MEKAKKKAKSENPHAGHRKRMYKKFYAAEPGSHPPHELLELLLFANFKQQNTNGHAHNLLDYFGSFHGVFEADFEDLQKVDGIGEESAHLINIVYACFRCYEESRAKPEKRITSTEAAGKYFVKKLKYDTVETPMVLLLNNRDGIIVCKPFGKGNVNSSPDDIRNLFKNILTRNTAGIYIAHNHPGGEAIPSNDDLNLTLRIRDICIEMNIDFKDHIIVADDKYCSVMEYLEKRR